MLWAGMVTYVTGMVNQELLLRNEYLGAENRILRGQIKGRLLLSEGESLGRIGGGREAGYAAGLVPKAHRQQVRRIEVSPTRLPVPPLPHVDKLFSGISRALVNRTNCSSQ